MPTQQLGLLRATDVDAYRPAPLDWTADQVAEWQGILAGAGLGVDMTTVDQVPETHPGLRPHRVFDPESRAAR